MSNMITISHFNTFMSRQNMSLLILLIVITTRFFSVSFTLGTDLNIYAQTDAATFAHHAASAAEHFRAGDFSPLTETRVFQQGHTNERIGLFYSPFWLLPGPGLLYASLFSGLAGSFAIYNVYVITRYVHSHQGGLIAIAPLVFFPSIVMVHGTVLREAFILFAVTTAARVWIAPPSGWSIRSRAVVAGSAMLAAGLFRFYLFTLLIAVLGVAFLLHVLHSRSVSYRTKIGATVGSVIIAPVSLIVISRYLVRIDVTDIVGTLSSLRSSRAYGRTAYHTTLEFAALSDVIAYSWIGMTYFLFSPFAWMVETLPDLVVFAEGTVALLFAYFSLRGAKAMFHRRPVVCWTLVFALLITAFVYGIGQANVGLSVRQRPVALWILFIFGGIGFTETYRIKI